MTKYRTVSEEEWPGCLFDPASKVEIDLFRHPFQFQAPPGWDTTPRKLKQHLLYMIMTGSCTALLDGQRVTLSAGQFCWVNPEVPLRLMARSASELPVSCRFRFAVKKRTTNYRLPWKYRIGNESIEMIEWARSLVAEAERPGPFAMDRMKSFVVLLSAHAFEQGRAQRSNEPSKLPRRLCEKLTKLVMEHPAKRFTPPELARDCGLSHDYFSRLFRNTFDVSPKQWLVKQRLRIAAGLLAESDTRISEVAEKLGYDDLYLFSRQFRAEFGMSPSQWRQVR